MNSWSDYLHSHCDERGEEIPRSNQKLKEGTRPRAVVTIRKRDALTGRDPHTLAVFVFILSVNILGTIPHSPC